MVGSGFALPHDLSERAPSGLETSDPLISLPSKRQLFNVDNTDSFLTNSTLITEGGHPIHVPGTRTTVIIVDLPQPIDEDQIRHLLFVSVRTQIHAHSLPDKGNQPIVPNFRVAERDRLTFTAMSVPPHITTWDILFETTMGLKIFMLDQGHHDGCDYVIEHEGVRVGMGSIRMPVAISK
ncbi:MAG: hypothetical protein Q9167_006351 [Letrouitia subvulpina]